MVRPDFKMLWSEKIPRIKNDHCEVVLISGEFGDQRFMEAPKNSWASDPENNVNIFLVKLAPGGKFTYQAKKDVNRSLYLFEGDEVEVNGTAIKGKRALFLDHNQDLTVVSKGSSEFLFLEARPIGEPVVQRGPFVMNTQEEIFQAIRDYQRTHFGDWKWQRHDMIHGPGTERFARYPDGTIERPGSK